MPEIESLIRPNILRLKPYATARHDFEGTAEIFLDANENSLGSATGQALNRYPDPLQSKLKIKVAQIKGVRPDQIFLGNGSDEAIDLLFRIFCEPGVHEAMVCSPTYGMYAVSAGIHHTPLIDIPLRSDFNWDVEKILANTTPNTRLLFICSPNNPSGNSIEAQALRQLITQFPGIVCVDEAYIDFSSQPSALRWLNDFDNLVVLQTFSKAWGAAALRLGMAFAQTQLIDWLNKVKAPYNISAPVQQLALDMLDNVAFVKESVATICQEREELAKSLSALNVVEQVFASDANFLLVRFKDAKNVYSHLLQHGIVVRDRSNLIHCHNCLRITVGTPAENQKLIKTLTNL